MLSLGMESDVIRGLLEIYDTGVTYLGFKYLLIK